MTFDEWLKKAHPNMCASCTPELHSAMRQCWKDCRADSANVCERMVVGGRAWTKEQAAAAKVLLAAAKNIKEADKEK